VNQSTSMSGPSRAGVAPMFNRIAHRYDLLNSVLSFGMDRNWRKKLLAALPEGEALEVLDLATGTADVAIALSKLDRINAITGVDIATEMLAFGEQKLKKQGIQKVTLEEGDALALDKFHGKFNAITLVSPPVFGSVPSTAPTESTCCLASAAHSQVTVRLTVTSTTRFQHFQVAKTS